jgi:hypothetical protein
MFPHALKSTTVMALVLSSFALMHAQKNDKPLPPASLVTDPVFVIDSVVTQQWPVLPAAANYPGTITLLNPGQCIRVGVMATGAAHEHFLDGLSIAYTVSSMGKQEDFPAQAAAASKLMKPDGGDFVTGALAAAGIKNPLETVSVLAVSATKWCVPQGAPDGTVQIKAQALLNGKTTALKECPIKIESIETAAAKTFKDKGDMGSWTMKYHFQPEPGRLLALAKFLASDSEENQIGLEFLKAAIKSDAETARTFGPSLAHLDKLARMLTMVLLLKDNVTLDQPPTLAKEDQDFLKTAEDLPDPYDWKPGTQIWRNLDLLWADFLATGRKEPIVAITGALAWKSDNDAFAEMQKKGIHPTELTDSITRGVTYGAAGWSLSSFDRNDPLAADYIQDIHADPKTSPQIRKALETLYSDPAFKQR